MFPRPGSLLAGLLLPFLAIVNLFRGWLHAETLVRLRLHELQARAREGDGLGRLTMDIEDLRQDTRVTALWIELDGTAASMTRLEELCDALERFRGASRKVFVSMAQAGNADLLLASVASRVLMVPSGELHAAGLAMRRFFIGGLLRRVGLLAEVFAAGDFKSAGEIFTRSFSSPESRLATSAVLDDLQTRWVELVASGRGRSHQEIREALERAPMDAHEALSRGLVDDLCWPDQVESRITENLGFKPIIQSYRGWRRWTLLERLVRSLQRSGPKVAVLHLSGTIIQQEPAGGSPVPVISAAELVPLLEELGERRDIASVVLSIDSGGGGALASDLIWRGVLSLQQKKPVVACFRGTAASGAYLFACAANEIFAQPCTITGSIGVIAARWSAAQALGRLGLHTEIVRGAPHADLFLPDRAMDRQEQERLQELVDRTYAVFIDRVAGGRRLPHRAVEPHAQGRIWTGRMALDRSLVDRLGTPREAFARACAMAGLSTDPRQTPRLDLRFEKKGLLRRLLRSGVHTRHLQAPFESELLRLLQEQPLLAPWGSSLRSSLSELLLLARASHAEPLALLPLKPEIE